MDGSPQRGSLHATTFGTLMPQSGRRPQHQKQTLDRRLLISAIHPKADIEGCAQNVRFVPKADILRCGK
jgi:hypothetical protein